jgi:hypothetical protein
MDVSHYRRHRPEIRDKFGARSSVQPSDNWRNASIRPILEDVSRGRRLIGGLWFISLEEVWQFLEMIALSLSL